VDDAARTGHVSQRLQDRWREQLERDQWWVFTPVPIHGDMAAEHLLHHSNRISAMTDFASVQVSDPAEDLAQILAPLPPDLAGSIVGAYRERRSDLEDAHLEDRAAFLGEIAIIRWLQHGLALDDEAIVDDAREMLADLDRAVQEEQEAAERAAAAEAAARAKLEEAKLAAEKEAWERREAAGRASRSAARERARTTGSTPRVEAEADYDGGVDDDSAAEADDDGGAAGGGGGAAWGGGAGARRLGPRTAKAGIGTVSGDLDWGSHSPSGPAGALNDWSPGAKAGGGSGAPKRKSVAEGGVSVWGKPRKPPTWADAEADEVGTKVGAAGAEPGKPTAKTAVGGEDAAAGADGAQGGGADGDVVKRVEPGTDEPDGVGGSGDSTAEANPETASPADLDVEDAEPTDEADRVGPDADKAAAKAVKGHDKADKAQVNADGANGPGRANIGAGPGSAEPVDTQRGEVDGDEGDEGDEGEGDGDGSDGSDEGDETSRARADRADQATDLDGEPDSQEMTQAFLPDFLRDESEAPHDIVEAAGRDSTEALERPDSATHRPD
jgi:hypothetical protein